MNDSADLLKQLRIDRSAPPPRDSRKGLWIGLAIAAAVLLALLVAWLAFGRNAAPEVRTAQVVAIGGSGGASASVLDATGYVALRRDFVERKPVTWYRLTAAGRKAVDRHLKALQAVIASAQG